MPRDLLLAYPTQVFELGVETVARPPNAPFLPHQQRVAHVLGQRRKEISEKLLHLARHVLSHQVVEPPTVAGPELAVPTHFVLLFSPPADQDRPDGRFLP